MKRLLASVAAAAICLASPTLAGQYTNPDGSVSNGVVMEMGGKPVSPANPMPASGGNFATTSPANWAAAVQTARLNNAAGNGVPTSTGFIPVGGREQSLVEWRILLPGTTFGNFIIGQASGLGSVQANITYFYIIEPCGTCLQ